MNQKYQSLKEIRIKAKERNSKLDNDILRSLLKEVSITSQLDCLYELALDSSHPAKVGDSYKVLT